MKLIDFLNKLKGEWYVALLLNEELECITRVGAKTLLQFYDYEITNISIAMVNGETGFEIYLKEQEDVKTSGRSYPGGL